MGSEDLNTSTLATFSKMLGDVRDVATGSEGPEYFDDADGQHDLQADSRCNG
jgi:hypothetical protein